MGEAKEGGAIVEGDEVSEFQLHFDDWVLDHDAVLVAKMSTCIHEGDFEFVVFLVVVNDALVEVVLHEIDIFLRDLLLSQNDLSLVLGSVDLLVIDDIPYLPDVRFSRGNHLYKMSRCYLRLGSLQLESICLLSWFGTPSLDCDFGDELDGNKLI